MLPHSSTPTVFFSDYFSQMERERCWAVVQYTSAPLRLIGEVAWLLRRLSTTTI